MLKCFWLERTNTVRRSLRRYTQGSTGYTCASGWHEAMVPFDDSPAIWGRELLGKWNRETLTHRDEDRPPLDDPRWPQQCRSCSYQFLPTDPKQFFWDLLYRDVDANELTTLRDAAPGAMWDAWWLHDISGGMAPPTADGLRLMVKLPNGREWFIDGRASNCTLPNDDVHHCWIRHGTPPDLVVDKNGVTCSAGAGSIAAPGYHGFLGTNGAPPGWFTNG